MRVLNGDKPEDLGAVIYTDANLPADEGDTKAQSGYVLVVESARGSLIPIAWSSKKQPITADSVDHAEMVACHLGVRECITLGHALTLDCLVPGEDNLPLGGILAGTRCHYSLNTHGRTSLFRVLAQKEYLALRGAIHFRV